MKGTYPPVDHNCTCLGRQRVEDAFEDPDSTHSIYSSIPSDMHQWISSGPNSGLPFRSGSQ